MPTQILPSVCPMDCPDTCSLEVEVTDGRIRKIRGSQENPLTAGFICAKVANFGRRVHGSERLLYPMRRSGAKGGGRFQRITWEEAIAMICQACREIQSRWGGEAILPVSYGGSNGLLGQDTSDKAFFARLGASRLLRAVCAMPTSEAAGGMYGKMPGVAFEDYPASRCIIIWGANPKSSNIHLVPFLKQAKANGAHIITIDPVRHFSDGEIDLHLPIYPGADLAVALALIRYWHEHGLLNWDFIRAHTVGIATLLEKAEPYTLARAAALARVEATAIERVARLYAECEPAVIRVGWGLERNRNGGQAAAAILALPAVLGKFGQRGGGYTLSNSAAFGFDACEMTAGDSWNTRVLNMNRLGRILLEENNPPVKMLFVYNCNPVATLPNQNAVLAGLQREDLFTVVFDQVMTDTAACADVLLPAVTFLEQHEIKKAYGSYALQYSAPVIAPVGEAKPNEEVFALLGRAMGWPEADFQRDTSAWLARAAGAIRGMGREISLEQLQRERIAFFDFPGRAPVQFVSVFPRTADGKIHLVPPQLGDRPYEFLAEENDPVHALALISPATGKTINSTMAEYNLPGLHLEMNPADAAARGLQSGEWVRVFNAHGEVICRLRIQARVRSGVVVMPKGAWRRAARNGKTANALTPDTLNAVGGGACFNDARVEVVQWP
ncbi:MAG: molybdopterin-dependent oxidoreductase [candidate division KSB1 bacterium]|nr:molybdopterin-dependent oxidoreductase [candidate division KSB1 bacterium]MDZ7272627.1 molybdopterin-dependent oxidoreductase [candidate division KSB1 bacterium]MDZ7284351.1 molybdopterin-dependent oxidoreductase [candidate division KSB1 bacterium]MDZ7297253.1 molybdopterin-dependent oxidoreductase [candidate division KSB1 bacterium]MDZ7307571.1 molybdopterin-dependent oxidoreductase [candidate division KSB1 bacterium]